MYSPRGENFLVTGSPSVGKTTLARRLGEALKTRNPLGFYTEPIVVASRRVAYRLVSFDGRSVELPLADATLMRQKGRFSVDGDALSEFLSGFNDSCEPALVILDEVGRFEASSPELAAFVRQWFAKDAVYVATMAERGPGIVAELREREDVNLYRLTRKNRDTLFEALLSDVAGSL